MKLWWPLGYGQPHMHDLRVRLGLHLCDGAHADPFCLLLFPGRPTETATAACLVVLVTPDVAYAIGVSSIVASPNELHLMRQVDFRAVPTADGGSAEVTSTVRKRVGFKHVQLVRRPLSGGHDGETFFFEVNGTPVFIKGAATCMVPQHSGSPVKPAQAAVGNPRVSHQPWFHPAFYLAAGLRRERGHIVAEFAEAVSPELDDILPALHLA